MGALPCTLLAWLLLLYVFKGPESRYRENNSLDKRLFLLTGGFYMEKIACDIAQMLNEKLALYKKLNAILQREKDCIVNIDIDALWKISGEKKKIVLKIHGLKEKIIDYIKQEPAIKDPDAGKFGLSYLLRSLALSSDARKQLRQIKLCLDLEKNELSRAADDNKQYVRESLSVIDDIMSVFAGDAENPRYRNTGTMPDSRVSNCLIHAKV